MTSAISGLSAALFRDEARPYVVIEQTGNKGCCFVALQTSPMPEIKIVVAGNSTPLSVSVSSNVVTVNSATDGGGVATSTSAQIVDAVNAHAQAKLLLLGRLSPGSDGSGIPGAFTQTPATYGIGFTGIELTDSGDHLTYQAAAGSRYWDETKSLTVYSDGSAVTSGFTVSYLKGSVTFSSSMTGHTITATGTRRSVYAMQKVMGLFDGKIKIDGKEIDTTSCDDTGWASYIMGSSSWELTASHYYYNGDIPLTEFKQPSLWKLYAVGCTTPFAIGKGVLMSIENILVSVNDAQKQNITVRGQGEIYLE